MELVQIYFKNLKKIAIITNFRYHFFSFYLKMFLDPDPGGKINTDSCGSGSTALVSGHGCPSFGGSNYH